MTILQEEQGYMWKNGDCICKGGTVVDGSEWEKITVEEAEVFKAEAENEDNVSEQ